MFGILLAAVFAVAIFRPDRIRHWARLWAGTTLLAIAMLLDCVGFLFYNPFGGVSQGSGDLGPFVSFASMLQGFLSAVKIIVLVQHCIMAVSVLVVLSALSEALAKPGEDSSEPDTVA